VRVPFTVPAELAASILDPEQLIRTLGSFALLGILAIVFAECGLLVGFFLPGDSLLFTAGLLVASGFLDYSIWLVCVLIAVAAAAGNLTGYWIGRTFGPRVLDRPDGRLFRREYVTRTQAFFDKYGGRAIVLARFVPIVRTFITVMAGAVRMSFGAFAAYSALGAVLWGVGVTILGYYLGNVEIIKNHIEIFLLGFVLLSVLPIVWELWRTRRPRASA
jgi:membrane-associated protein